MDEAIKIVGQCSRNFSEKFKMDIFVAKLEELPVWTQNLLVYISSHLQMLIAQPLLECTSRKNTPKFLCNVGLGGLIIRGQKYSRSLVSPYSTIQI